MPADVQVIENRSASPLKVWLEPWVEHVEIPAHAAAEFHSSSDYPGQLEIQASEKPVVYGWSGSTLKVLVEGKDIWESYAAAPPIPARMSMRGFVDLLFGEERREP